MLNRGELENILFFEGLEGLGKFYSLYRGFCEDNNDPNNQNRIKVSCAEVYGQGLIHELWALPLDVTMVSDFYVIKPPKIGEEVILLFRKGNFRYPVYVRSPQRKALVEINTVLNDKNINPELFTALVGDAVIDINNNRVEVRQADNFLTIEPQKTTFDKGGTVSANIKGDTLRQQLTELKEQQQEIVNVLSELTTTISAYHTAASGLMPTLAPASAASVPLLTSYIVRLQTINLKLESINIDSNKSDVLFNE